MNEWIDIKESVPDRVDDYLVCDRNGVMFVCSFYPEHNRWVYIGDIDFGGIYYSDEGYIRFWMELPEEPMGLFY